MIWIQIALLLFTLYNPSHAETLSLDKYARLQVCYEITTSEALNQRQTLSSILKHPISENLEPGLNISLPLTSSYSNNPNLILKTIILSGEDFKKVRLPKIGRYCDKYSAQYCPSEARHPNDELNAKENIGKIPLQELIDGHSNQSPVLQADLAPFHPENPNARQYVTYPVDKTGVYCFRYDSENGPAVGEKATHLNGVDSSTNAILITLTNTWGYLTHFDYIHKLVLYLYLSLAYAIFGVVFGLRYFPIKTLFFKSNNGNSFTPANLSSKFQELKSSSPIQFSFLIYILGAFSTYFFSFVYYLKLNHYGYETYNASTLFTHFIVFITSIIFNAWVIYNFMMLSNGSIFNLQISAKKQKAIKLIAAILIFELLVYDASHQVYWLLLDYEIGDTASRFIYLQLVGLTLLCCLWSYQMVKKLDNQVITRKLVTSYGLVFLVVLFYVVSNHFQKSTRSDEITSSISSEIFSLLITGVVAHIWKDVKLNGSTLPA
ncbi:unnamed protein product [Ambrosiozyma monospora]|uniref:Unnamed protein product n=1 Tax=Ambrosiozyma monospora TaxID=43982 RepID=A0A9W7DGR5_AMBMO|nr:unnamed protein product [Ambrosiozyma monospora]